MARPMRRKRLVTCRWTCLGWSTEQRGLLACLCDWAPGSLGALACALDPDRLPRRRCARRDRQIRSGRAVRSGCVGARHAPGGASAYHHVPDVLLAHGLLPEQHSARGHHRHVLDDVHDRVHIALGDVLVVGPGWTGERITLFPVVLDALDDGEPAPLQHVIDGHRVVTVRRHDLARVDELDADETVRSGARQLLAIAVDQGAEAPLGLADGVLAELAE